MKKTSAKNTASRTAKSTGGRAAGRTQRAASNAKSAAAGGRKAATSRTRTASKATTAAKPKAKTATKAKTAAKTAPKKVAARGNSRLTAPKTPARNSRATARVKQSTAKDLLMDFFHDELKDIYWAEKNIVKTLPKLKKAATSQELKDAFDAHLAETQEHVSRLEEVFELLGKKAQAKKCDAMEGIIKEGEEIISDTDAGTATRDVGLILAAQKVEHYEIATYGGLAQLARTLRLNDVAALLETTLQEEKNADSKLTNVAESHVNYDALNESEGPQANANAARGAAAGAAASVGGDEDDDEEEDIDFEEADIDEEDSDDEDADEESYDDEDDDLDEEDDEDEDEEA